MPISTSLRRLAAELDAEESAQRRDKQRLERELESARSKQRAAETKLESVEEQLEDLQHVRSTCAALSRLQRDGPELLRSRPLLFCLCAVSALKYCGTERCYVLLLQLGSAAWLRVRAACPLRSAPAQVASRPPARSARSLAAAPQGGGRGGARHARRQDFGSLAGGRDATVRAGGGAVSALTARGPQGGGGGAGPSAHRRRRMLRHRFKPSLGNVARRARNNACAARRLTEVTVRRAWRRGPFGDVAQPSSAARRRSDLLIKSLSVTRRSWV